MIDRVTRRSATVSLVFHATLCLLALAPAVILKPAALEQPPAAAPEPPKPQRLVLAPLPKPPPAPPLPKLGVAALPGIADQGSAPLAADVTVPRNTDRPAQDRSRGSDGAEAAEVDLPRLAQDPATMAGRLNGKRWTNQELTSEQKRLTDATNFLDFRIHHEYRVAWFRLKTPTTRPRLILRVVVDEHGRLLEAQRGNSTGSTALDEAIDQWLRQDQEPVTLPSITPRIPHFLAVTLYDSR